MGYLINYLQAPVPQMADDIQLYYLLSNPVLNIEPEWPVPVTLRRKQLILFFNCLCDRLYPTDIYHDIYLIFLIALDDVKRLLLAIILLCLCESIPNHGINFR
jgi:hypothetical protein